MSRGTGPQKGVIYKVNSRRLGRSLGVNILGAAKACNLSCCYCQYPGRALSDTYGVESFPSERVLDAVEQALHREGWWYEVVTFSGNGEPTLHPEFPPIAGEVKRLLTPYGRPMAILTNSSTARLPHVREALRHFDMRYMKLDAGSEEWFRRVNRPAGVAFADVMEGLTALDSFCIQTMLFSGNNVGTGENGNCAEESLRGLAEAYRVLNSPHGRVEEVHLYTAERASGNEAVGEVPFERLKEIAGRFSRETGIRVTAFYGGRRQSYGQAVSP